MKSESFLDIYYKKGFLYVRTNELCTSKNILKWGITFSAKDRVGSYITSEHKRGEFILVIEIPLDKMRIIDTCLKNYLQSYLNYIDAGTEFYEPCIINLIEPFLKQSNVKYRILSKNEIDCLERCERLRTLPKLHKIKNEFKNIKISNIIQQYKNKKMSSVISNDSILSSDYFTCNDIDDMNENRYTNQNTIIPLEHQQKVLDNIQLYYEQNDKGKINWPCGVGKALIAILIAKWLEFKTIILGVSNKKLQRQLKEEILLVFPNKKNILFVGGDTMTTTNKQQILYFLTNKTNNEPKFIISTYHSCYLLVDLNLSVDFKIGDEAHHLVGFEKEEEKGFRLFHKIQSKKSLFMTATEKLMELSPSFMLSYNSNKEIYSMDDESIFGKCIDFKTTQWAIENKKITDYSIVVIKKTEDDVDAIIVKLNIDVSNKEIFIACYMCLLSFEKYENLTHVLLYMNNTKDAEQAQKYIDDILSLGVLSISKELVYNKALHSKNCKNVDKEIDIFKHSEYGIIPCVYIFMEGFNLPKLNGVCVVGNMQSETRIVQSLLRPNRLERGNPNKKAYIIIPYIDSDNWETENKSFERVRAIISQMRNVDENIGQKIVVCSSKKKNPIEIKEIDNEIDRRRNMWFLEDSYFDENADELNKIVLRLRYSKALGSKYSEEQDEYNYVRSLNISLNIQSKKEYHESQMQSTYPFPEEYFKKKGVWKDWYDFMGVNTRIFLQTKEEWNTFCKEKKIKSLESYFEACYVYPVLPKEPDEFYLGFTNIPLELGFHKRRILN